MTFRQIDVVEILIKNMSTVPTNNTLPTLPTQTMPTQTPPIANVTESFNLIIDYPDTCVILSAISCVLSIFGALGIFCTYGLLPEIRNVTRKLILCLTVADLLSACGYLMSVFRYANINVVGVERGPQPMPELCVAQSVITTYSSMVSFFLTVFIGVHLASTVTQRRDRTGTTLAFVIFNIVSWTVPGTIVIFAFMYGVLGEDMSSTGGTGPWCWINTEMKTPTFWMLITGKGWEILCFLITVSIYILIKFYQYLYYQRSDLQGIHESLRNDDKNVLYLWFVLYLLRIWGTLRFLIYAFHPGVSKTETYMEVFLFLQAFGDPAQAFFNFILFCVFDKTVKTHMHTWWRSFRNTVICDSYRRVEDDNTEVKDSEAGYGDRLTARAVPTYGSFVDCHSNCTRTAARQELTSSELTSMT